MSWTFAPWRLAILTVSPPCSTVEAVAQWAEDRLAEEGIDLPVHHTSLDEDIDESGNGCYIARIRWQMGYVEVY